jgi:hypothetical protein
LDQNGSFRISEKSGGGYGLAMGTGLAGESSSIYDRPYTNHASIKYKGS